MLVLRGTFVSWETLYSLVSTRYVTDLLVYQTHIAQKEQIDELFDQEIDWLFHKLLRADWPKHSSVYGSMTGLTPIGNVFLRVSLCAQKRWNRNGSSQPDIQPLRAALEGSSWEHGVRTPRKHVDWIRLFVHSIGIEPETSLAALRFAGFALNRGCINNIPYNSQNDCIPWGNC